MQMNEFDFNRSMHAFFHTAVLRSRWVMTASDLEKKIECLN
eukprot:COSAG06_NODE_6898_length_2724_cov_45.057143_3_plen_41_part_00